MPICLECQQEFPFIKSNDNGKIVLGSRMYCLACSPPGERQKCGNRGSHIVGFDITTTKVCTKCNIERPIDNFHISQIRTNHERVRYSCCKQCKGKKAALLHKSLKTKAVQLMGGQCLDCKGTFPESVFEFHHLEPEHKDVGIAKLRSWPKIIRELAKCVMLCANCHRIRHDASLLDSH